MPGLFVEKSVEIHAPAPRVWKVLTDPVLSKQWIEAFWPGFNILESEWKSGSDMHWNSADGNIHGKILAIQPNRSVRYSFTMPQDIVTLKLDERHGRTVLSVAHGDFMDKPDGEECYQGALAGWDIALAKVKGLAET